MIYETGSARIDLLLRRLSLTSGEYLRSRQGRSVRAKLLALAKEDGVEEQADSALSLIVLTSP